MAHEPGPGEPQKAEAAVSWPQGSRWGQGATGENTREEEPSTPSLAACGPAFIGLQIKAGVWAAGDLSGSLRPCGPKDIVDLSQLRGELISHTIWRLLSSEAGDRMS